MLQASLPCDLEEVVLTLMEDLATPTSLKVAILVRYGCWDDLAALQVDPKHFKDPDDYWAAACAVGFLKKYEPLPTTVDRADAAYENFVKAEKMCFRTNQNLVSRFRMGLPRPEDEWLHSFVSGVRKKIKAVLGPVPRQFSGKHGPGATYGDKGRLTLVADKHTSRPTMTPGAWLHLRSWSETAWHRATAVLQPQGPEVVRGNRFTTVPKDAKKDRGIAVEPSINVFYQLGLGLHIRNRLRRWGIDLQDGQRLHQDIARESSVTGNYATIDLSNASDTVARELVRLLLPEDWFELLASLRSPHTLVRGKWVYLEKFSSMGNGFTFELETLIFLCLSWQVVDDQGPSLPGKNLWVYGDDIIVPSASAKGVLRCLEYFGFEPNPDKTFYEGSFRESCGGDFFDGVDVRPYFLKKEPNEPPNWISIANGLRVLGNSDGENSRRHTATSRARLRCLANLPDVVRQCRGPSELGDIVIHDDEPTWKFKWRHGIRYLRVTLTGPPLKVSWRHFSAEAVMATALYRAGWSESGDSPHSPLGTPCGDREDFVPRSKPKGYRLGWVPFS